MYGAPHSHEAPAAQHVHGNASVLASLLPEQACSLFEDTHQRWVMHLQQTDTMSEGHFATLQVCDCFQAVAVLLQSSMLWVGCKVHVMAVWC